MKKIYLLLSVLVMSFMANVTLAEEPKSDSNRYLLGMGDQIQILVYNEADLSMKIRIDESGKIMYPLIGELQLEGKTPTQVANEIQARLKDGYVNNPMVTVIMLEFGPIYVSGEVKTPGSYEYQPGFTLEKTIAVAGGFTDRADRDDINVRRANGTLLEDVTETEVIYPGDVVIVGQSFF
ncbi:polysaccharide biosynthesis/export family protein [Vibrio algivorus]|nr:polysaccharide biosynthesis/export family protein [Vibrio algivorus]TVO34407.1 polysaccharide export protein [Vibrio algivorus]